MANRCDVSTTAVRFRHHIPLQMRFIDIDMLGHLNNSVYFTFMDMAKSRYFQAVLGDKLDFSRFGVVIVNINCDFFAQTFYNDTIECETAVVAIGEKSLTIEQRIFSPDSGEVKCHCRTIMAGIDVKAKTSAPITDEWRKALEEYEERSF